MKYRFACGMILSLLGSAMPAAAAEYVFQLTGSPSVTFGIDESRVPDSFTASQSFFAQTPGTYAGKQGTADVSFSKDFFNGTTSSFAIDLGLPGYSPFTTPETLFTGTTAQPIFKTGVFNVTSAVSGQSLLIVTQPHSIEATVPEPTSWAMLVIGMGITGGAVRRQRAVAANIG